LSNHWLISELLHRYVLVVGEAHLQESVLSEVQKDFTALPEELTVDQALRRIREHGIKEGVVYFYVIDAEEKLVGVLPTRRLLISQPDQVIRDIMIRRVVAIPQTATVLDAYELFILHRFLALPVVDGERRILGVLNITQFTEDMIDLGENSSTEDMFQTIGFRVAEVQNASPVRGFRFRFPWLLATIGSGTACALLSGLYERTLAESLVLAFFLTLVLGLGESVSTQSLTVTLQSLHGVRPEWGWFRRALKREFLTALMLGAGCGLIVGLIVLGWRRDPFAALVIGGSILGSMVVACLVGLGVPTLLHRLKLDPKIASGPLTLALADVATLLIYFNVAMAVL
jgi:magnesium transporter